MAKPKFYGKTTAHIPNKRRDLRFIKKNQRNREKPQRILVAGRRSRKRRNKKCFGLFSA